MFSRPSVRRFGSVRPRLLLGLLATLSLPLSTLGKGQNPETKSLLEAALALEQSSSATQPVDRKAVFEAYNTAALQENDAYAQLRLGMLYETGEGVEQSFTEAFSHYQKALDKGLVAARVRLAMCYLEGWGTPINKASFVEQITLAAEADYAPAQRILSDLYMSGIGVPRDQALATQWLEKAALQDDKEAQTELGWQALQLKKDKELARSWFRLSVDQDYSAAMRAMGRTFLSGKRGSRDYRTGMRWLELATEDGDATAPFLMAKAIITHPDNEVRDEAKALELLHLADQRKSSSARDILDQYTDGCSLKEAFFNASLSTQSERHIQRIRSHIHSMGDTRPACPVRTPVPLYPGALRLLGIEGEATIRFVVNAKGCVESAEVHSATHPLFGAYAKRSVESYFFEPALKSGRPVVCKMQLPFVFSLSEKLPATARLLGLAKRWAQELGEEASNDAEILRIGRPIDYRVSPPTVVMPDGSEAPENARVSLLLVLNEQNYAVRGHILKASPAEAGASTLQAALGKHYSYLGKVKAGLIPGILVNYSSPAKVRSLSLEAKAP